MSQRPGLPVRSLLICTRILSELKISIFVISSNSDEKAASGCCCLTGNCEVVTECHWLAQLHPQVYPLPDQVAEMALLSLPFLHIKPAPF